MYRRICRDMCVFVQGLGSGMRFPFNTFMGLYTDVQNIYIHVYMYTDVYVCICMYVCMYVCMYIYIYR